MNYSTVNVHDQSHKHKNLGFSVGHNAQTIHPDQNSHTQGISLVCQLAYEMIPIAKNCHLTAMIRKHPPQNYPVLHFSGLKTPYAEIWKFLLVYAPAMNHSCYFKRSKLVQAAVLQSQKKTCSRSLGAIWRNPLGDFPLVFWCDITTFYSNQFRFGGVITN